MTLGEELKRARNASGFKQEIVAAKLGVTVQAVSQWENDKSMPDADHLLAVLRTLGMIPQEFGVSDGNGDNAVTKSIILPELKRYESIPRQAHTNVTSMGDVVSISQIDRDTQNIAIIGRANLDLLIAALQKAREALS